MDANGVARGGGLRVRLGGARALRRAERLHPGRGSALPRSHPTFRSRPTTLRSARPSTEVDRCAALGAVGIGRADARRSGIRSRRRGAGRAGNVRCPRVRSAGHDPFRPNRSATSIPEKAPSPPAASTGSPCAFPVLRLICAHWGGGLPFYELMPEVADALRNVYYDTAASLFLYRPAIFSAAVAAVGAKQDPLWHRLPARRPGALAHVRPASRACRRTDARPYWAATPHACSDWRRSEMPQVRTFVALELPDEVREALAQVQTDLRSPGPDPTTAARHLPEMGRAGGDPSDPAVPWRRRSRPHPGNRAGRRRGRRRNDSPTPGFAFRGRLP